MKANKNHVNIPIFIPEMACPHQCVFCNQQKISGTINAPKPAEIKEIINKYLSTLNKNIETEIAFFGGSFTGIPIKLQEEYLIEAHKFIKSGKVNSIRVSTRPDYIDENILQILKKYGVKTIELGAQSTDNYVLNKSGRGHNFEAIKNSAILIKSFGFELGLQMMIGLPGDTREKSIQTALDIVALGADNTRIYPTLVVKDTELEKLYITGKYVPLQINEAVSITKELINIFHKNNIKVLRVGLHPSEELTPENSFIAGPIHNSFKELVLTDIWKDILTEKLNNFMPSEYKFVVNSNQINYAVGYKKSNIKYFYSKGFKLKFFGKLEIPLFEIHDCNN